MRLPFSWLPALTPAALILSIVTGVLAERIEPESIEFELPFSMSLPPGVAVFFQGHEFRDGIALYRGPQDTIRARSGGTDIAAWPRPRNAPAPVSILSLQRIYGEVPFVKNRLITGDEQSWRAAAADYRSIQREARFMMAAAYWNVLERDSTDLEGALIAAQDALVPYDRHLDEGRGLFERAGGDLILYWKGRKPCAETVLLHTGRFPATDPAALARTLDEEEARRALALFYRHASGAARNAALIYHNRGLHVLTGSLAAAAFDQIRRSHAGGLAPGPLHGSELREIVAVRAKEGG